MESGFEEIVTPFFSYMSHLDVKEDKKFIRLQNERNHTIALRPDSTLDVVRIITKRLGRSTGHRKWFYIQPVFIFPNEEHYQIGAELIGCSDIGENLSLAVKIVESFSIEPVLQLSNIQIPITLSRLLNVDIDIFKTGNIEEILDLNEPWLNALIYVRNSAHLEKAIEAAPDSIRQELVRLHRLGERTAYANKVYAPLYYASMEYYEGLFFRMFMNNQTLLMGGVYRGEEIHSCGFAIYTDPIVEMKVENEEKDQ